MIGRSEQYHAALASPSRRQILDALLASSTPLDAAGVGERLGLHVTTARFHLDQLTEAGLVRRRIAAEKRRGRPRLLYSPAGAVRDEDARGQLIQVLAGALAREENPVPEAIAAGRHWAESLDVPASNDLVPALIGVLDRLGFEPEGDQDAGPIRLRACPFRAAAREHPEVVCEVHRGLIEQLLDGGSPRGELFPFVEPELCLVTLERGI